LLTKKSELDKLVLEYNLNIVKVFEESVSGKAPGRPKFNEMMEMIYLGKADAIIAWHNNRLSRNAKDAGEVQHLLITNKIKAIITMQRVYYPEDNALLLSVETGMSTQFITDLRNATNRGLRSKAQSGWMPSRPPIGWVNNKDTHMIDVDDQDNRFMLVRKMWDHMLTGNYSVAEIWKKEY
jgi:site-specific DNA recombinase